MAIYLPEAHQCDRLAHLCQDAINSQVAPITRSVVALADGMPVSTAWFLNVAERSFATPAACLGQVCEHTMIVPDVEMGLGDWIVVAGGRVYKKS